MSKYIYRTIEQTVCHYIYVNDDGEVIESVLYLPGHLKTLDAATRRMRKKYNDQSMTVRKIEYRKTRYRMPVEDFVKLSEEMEDVE